MVLAMSSEATAVSILVRTWLPTVPVSLLGCAIIIGITLLNLLGADKLSKLESGLAAIKLFAVLSFIFIALLLVLGLFPGKAAVGAGSLSGEPFMPFGFTGLAGSMLLVMFTYAGFEIIGLAASEAENPKVTVPRAIKYTVISLVGLYIVYVIMLLPLIPTADLSEHVSPIVAALNRHGIGWAGTALNVVLISAILSTMLAAMFGLGRMMRSISDEGHAPAWLRDKTDVPRRGIAASGFGMLLAQGLGLLFPSVYLFLISSGGFALLFSYAAIVATHVRYRKLNGCPDGKCQVWGYPYSSIIVLIALIAAIFSMPFVAGQSSGLVAGIVIVALFVGAYFVMRLFRHSKLSVAYYRKHPQPAEFSKELSDFKKDEKDK